jgi:PEP-CTERM motif
MSKLVPDLIHMPSTGRGSLCGRIHRSLVCCFGVAVFTLSSGIARAEKFQPNRGAPLHYSVKAYSKCIAEGKPREHCAKLGKLIDPPTVGLTSLSFSYEYDPTLWTFLPNESGLLCELSLGGGCPSPEAQIGTFPLTELPDTATPGAPLPGASLSVVNDAAAGIVTISYVLGSPILSDATETSDRNIFLLMFEAAVPFDAGSLLVTYFDQPGNYQFTQLSASCTTTHPEWTCGSDTPVTGLSISTVPEPATSGMIVVGLGLVGWHMRKVRRIG